jgi:CheY-like chemotaxis protein
MRKVLIADDRAPGRELLRVVLEQSSCVVYEASDGIEALQSARELLPDLIILDLHMPVLDGFGVLEELRLDLRFATTPIIALTASAMQGDRELALSAGFTTYIAKPISLRALRGEIERFFHVK